MTAQTPTTRTPRTPTGDHFEHYSEMNAAIVESERTCECKAYEDIFTYNRWQDLGFQVQKGEHGTRILTYVQTFKIDEKGDKVPAGSYPRTSIVFCRCQVKPKGEKNQ